MNTRIATSKDLPILKEFWYECFLEHDSKESIDYYFENSFDLEHTFILEAEDEIVCSLQLNQHQIAYQGEVESVSFVVGVATPIRYRRKGYMRTLLNEAIKYAKDVLKQNYMILQAYDWSVYTSFGFYEAYYKQEVFFSTEELKVVTAIDEEEVNPQKLLDIYREYTKNLDGYKMRDIEYYDKMLKMYQVEGGSVLSTEGAYLIYHIDEYIEVNECAYTNDEELKKALKILSDKYQKDIRVKIDNLYVKENSKKLVYMMVKDLNKEFKVMDNLYISEEI